MNLHENITLETTNFFILKMKAQNESTFNGFNLFFITDFNITNKIAV